MQIPQLTAFRFFDAAARTQSFVKAAQELNVTHGAVSRQIRLLEESLGVELFERRNRAIFLNAAGKTLFEVTRPLFVQLETVVGQLRHGGRDEVLTLSCEPTIAMKWLIPRLPTFQAEHPDISIHLVTAGGPVDFVRSGVDVALRRDDFHWPGELHAERICDERVGPVSRDPAWQTARQSCVGMTLLHTRSRPDAWQTWAARAGWSLQGGKFAHYEHFYLCLQAAQAGLGSALASFLMVQDELIGGQLSAPCGFIADGSGYYLLSPPTVAQSRNYRCFRDWIMAQLAGYSPSV